MRSRSGPEAIAPARALPPALRALRDGLHRDPPRDARALAKRLARCPVAPEALAPWSDFDHAVGDSYGRRLVCRGPHYEILVMSWAPGDHSAIHDHGHAQWGAVRYLGVARHATFHFEGRRLSLATETRTRAGSVSAVPPSLIHLMGNPGATPFLSLHVYGTREATPEITADARVFDLLEGAIQRTNGGVFFCLPEAAISRREGGIAATPTASALHHRLMLERAERMDAAAPTPALAARRAALHAALSRLGGAA